MTLLFSFIHFRTSSIKKEKWNATERIIWRILQFLWDLYIEKKTVMKPKINAEFLEKWRIHLFNNWQKLTAHFNIWFMASTLILVFVMLFPCSVVQFIVLYNSLSPTPLKYQFWYYFWLLKSIMTINHDPVFKVHLVR